MPRDRWILTEVYFSSSYTVIDASLFRFYRAIRWGNTIIPLYIQKLGKICLHSRLCEGRNAVCVAINYNVICNTCQIVRDILSNGIRDRPTLCKRYGSLFLNRDLRLTRYCCHYPRVFFLSIFKGRAGFNRSRNVANKKHSTTLRPMIEWIATLYKNPTVWRTICQPEMQTFLEMRISF